jgi:hypothetical protein
MLLSASRQDASTHEVSTYLEAVFIADVVSCESPYGQRTIRKVAAGGGRSTPAWLQQLHSLRRTPLPSPWPAVVDAGRGLEGSEALSRHCLRPLGEVPLSLGSWPSCWPPQRVSDELHGPRSVDLPAEPRHRKAFLVRCSGGRTLSPGALARELQVRFGMTSLTVAGSNNSNNNNGGLVELIGCEAGERERERERNSDLFPSLDQVRFAVTRWR